MSIDDWTEVQWHEVKVGGLVGQFATGRTPNGRWEWNHPWIRNTEGTRGDSREAAIKAGTAELEARLVK